MLQIGELARLTGVSSLAIRHHHHIGLLPEPARTPGGYRTAASAGSDGCWGATRSTSCPQLFDVLAGTMSLVGPRPPRPIEMDGADVEAMRRLLVRPGMTGLWQVLRDRAHTDWDESIRLDLRYVENWTLLLDVVILLRTLRSLVRRTRAV